MENPNYVLKFNQGVLMPVDGNPSYNWLQKATIIIVVIIIVGSFIFRENLFMELNWGARLLLIALVCQTLFLGRRKKRQPVPIEIVFMKTTW